MPRKILVGLALVAIGCAVAGSGYKFGQYLAARGKAAEVQVPPTG